MNKTGLALICVVPLMACTKKEPAEAQTDKAAEPVAAAEAPATEATGIIGRWVSDEDPLSVIIISGTPDRLSQTSEYDGQVEETEAFRYASDCGTAAAVVAHSDYFTVGGGDEALCYKILSLTADELVLSYLPRGNTLSYSRN